MLLGLTWSHFGHTTCSWRNRKLKFSTSIERNCFNVKIEIGMESSSAILVCCCSWLVSLSWLLLLLPLSFPPPPASLMLEDCGWYPILLWSMHGKSVVDALASPLARYGPQLQCYVAKSLFWGSSIDSLGYQTCILHPYEDIQANVRSVFQICLMNLCREEQLWTTQDIHCWHIHSLHLCCPTLHVEQSSFYHQSLHVRVYSWTYHT